MNRKYSDILKLARFQLLIIPIFILFKVIRPSILEGTSSEIYKLTLRSLPNFFEAITGTLTLTGVGLIVNDRFNKNRIPLRIIYFLAVILAGIYVLLQEFKMLNFRGNSTFDQNDVIFSHIGLLVGYLIVLFMKPHIYNES